MNLKCLAYPQIDPSEKLDPEVEDILSDIAEDFVESVSSSHYIVFKYVLCEYHERFKSQTFLSSDDFFFFLIPARRFSFHPDHNIWLFFSQA